jgi:hypothetical protein
MATGKRIKDPTLTQQTTFVPEYRVLVDRIDTGSGDWLQARNMELSLLGNTYYQGSTNGINWHDEVTGSDTYIRFTTDGGSTWIDLDTDLVREGTTNLYYTEARVSANIDVNANSIARHTHTNLPTLENIINNGTGNNFLADDGTYKNAAAVGSPVTTKGDIYTYSTTDDRLPVGTDGYMLAANSTESTGLEWVPAPTGVTDHTLLTNIGVNTHNQIDTHISSTSNPHSVTLEQARTILNQLSGNIDFNNNDIDNLKALGFQSGQDITWNSDFYTLNIPTGLGPILQIGQEFYFVIYNDTGVQIDNGLIVKPVSATVVGSEVIPTVILAKADSFETCEGTLMVVTGDIPNGSVGFGTITGRVSDVDTSGLTVGDDLFLSATVAGGFTNVQPQFPNYALSLGGVLKVDALAGQIAVNFTNKVEDTFNNAWDGAFRETMDFTVSSNGTTITGSLEQNGGGDLTMIFSDGFSTLDCTPAATITLTPGTDTAPVMNYVYIPISTKVLTVSTSGFPTDEHIKVADLFLRSALTTQTDDALVNRNWNDHVKTVADNGHLLHITEKLRQLEAQWDNGTEGTCTVGGGTTVDFTVTSGNVYQLHKQSFPSFDTSTGDDIHVPNHFTTPYFTTTNPEDLTADASGNSLNNTAYSWVLWGVQNKSGEASHIMINLPTDTYSKNTPDDAVNDPFNYSVYEIPSAFKGKGFLIARFTFINNGGTISLYDTEDLRGKIPNTTAGGGAGGSGITTFLGLTDTPSSYTGQSGKIPAVNVGETALEFITAGSGDMTTTVYDPAGINEQLVGLTAIQTLTNKTITSPLGIVSDDIDDSTSVNKFTTSADITRLANTSGTNTGDQDLSAYALSTDLTDGSVNANFLSVITTDEVYGVAWNGSLEVPTKNAVYDKIESISTHDPVTLAVSATTGGLSLSVQEIGFQAATTAQNGYLTSTDWNTFDGKQDVLTFGIANTNAVQIDSADVLSGEYAKFTASGLQGRSTSEVKVDLSLDNVENTALSTWAGSTNLTTLGTITTGTWNAGDITISKASPVLEVSATSGEPVIKLNGNGSNLIYENTGVQKWNLKSASTVGSNNFILYNNGGTNSNNIVVEHATGDVTIEKNLTIGGDVETTASSTNAYIGSNFVSNSVGNISNFGGSDAGFYFDTGGIIRFVTFGVNRHTFDASGNITFGGDLNFNDTNTTISEDGSSNLTFKDAVTGTKTLAELAAGGSATPFNQSFTATASQTTFTLSNTPAAAWVWVKGAVQDKSTWSISGDNIVLTTALDAGDKVEVYYLTSTGSLDVLNWDPPQTITYSTTPSQDFTVSSNATITLTGNVTTYTLQNVSDGGFGEIEVVQNATGGYGISAIAHSGLSVIYVPGVVPTAANIESDPSDRVIISYKRMGSYLYIAFTSTDLSLPRTAEINAQTGTTYTLLSTDNGKIVTLNNASAVTVTVPSGLGSGFNCTLVQLGAGTVSVSASSTTINNRNSHTSMAGQYGSATLVAYASNTFIFQGDTA